MKATITYVSGKSETFDNIKNLYHDGLWEIRIVFSNGLSKSIDRCTIESFSVSAM